MSPLPDTAVHLAGLRPEDLVSALAARGAELRLREARQVLSHVLSRSAEGWPHGLRSASVRALETHTRRGGLEVQERVVDPLDGSVRYLFAAPDRAVFEAVRIPLHKAGRFSVCLSSQVGCAMACAFCATGRLGLSRDLAAWEMVEAWRRVRDEVLAERAEARVTGAVFMGQGEPLHNYEAVIRAAQVLSEPNGGRIAKEAISISTVGLVPQIRRFTAEGHRFRLIVSLTSARPERRAALLPVAGRSDLASLVEALRAHQAASGDRLTLAWVLLGGVNHDLAEVEALKALLGDLPLRLNLIDVNEDRQGPEAFRRASDPERAAFHDALRALGVPVVRRFSVGRSQGSACGMLASRSSRA